jgi:hypothetical protein
LRHCGLFRDPQFKQPRCFLPSAIFARRFHAATTASAASASAGEKVEGRGVWRFFLTGGASSSSNNALSCGMVRCERRKWREHNSVGGGVAACKAAAAM